MNYTDEGYIQACLAFMEQNKETYPDSYKRAVEIFDDYKKNPNRSFEVVTVASELDGLIKGIAELSKTD